MASEVVETAVIQVEADMKAFTKDVAAAKRQAEQLGDKVSNALEQAIVGGRSLEDIFSKLALDISKSFLNAGLSPLKDLLSNSVSSLSGSLLSSLVSSGASSSSSLLSQLTPFAKGGVVSSPTLFPMQSGTGLMGEAGSEAILPLQRGADGRLGVAAPSAKAQSVSVIMNVTAQDAQSFSKSENQIALKLARAVKRGRRGL